jgi:hypothetical protein
VFIRTGWLPKNVIGAFGNTTPPGKKRVVRHDLDACPATHTEPHVATLNFARRLSLFDGWDHTAFGVNSAY